MNEDFSFSAQRVVFCLLRAGRKETLLLDCSVLELITFRLSVDEDKVTVNDL